MLDGDGEASSEANVEPFCFEPARAVAYCIIRGLAIVSSSKRLFPHARNIAQLRAALLYFPMLDVQDYLLRMRRHMCSQLQRIYFFKLK